MLVKFVTVTLSILRSLATDGKSVYDRAFKELPEIRFTCSIMCQLFIPAYYLCSLDAKCSFITVNTFRNKYPEQKCVCVIVIRPKNTYSFYIFCPSSETILPMAIHTVNRIQVRKLSFIMRKTLTRILAPGVSGTNGTYRTINLLSLCSHC